MQYADAPPKPKTKKKDEKVKFPEAVVDNGGGSEFPIRKACISDVKEILDLVNGFAASNLMLSRGPQYIYENIRDYVVAVDENNVGALEKEATETAIGKAKGMIVACGSLHVLWADMAEIRSLAIHQDYQNRGLGKRVIENMKKDAKRLGIRQLFTFTVAEDFFTSLGFQPKTREELPPKVWGECSRCPKYFKCDEVGLVLEI